MEKPHLLADLCDRALRELARAIRAGPEPLTQALRVALQRGRALSHRRERGDHVVGELALAVNAAPPRAAALVRDLRHHVGRREALMQRIDVADLGGAGVFPRDPRWIGGGRLQLFPDRFRRLEETDRIAETLRHLGLAVEAQDALRLAEQGLRLREIACTKTR